MTNLRVHWHRSLGMFVLIGLLVGCGWSRDDAATVLPVYVGLGASDAVGVGATRPETDGWVPLVAEGLPEGSRLLNLGVSGATLSEVIAGQLPVALDRSPRWVTIWPGPNDFRNGVPLATFSAQLEELLEALRPTAGQQRTVAVLNLPDLRGVPSFVRFGTDLDPRVREWNAATAEVVARHGDYTVLVDLYSDQDGLGTRPDYISADAFHPSSAGYRRIAELTQAALRRDDR